MNAEDLSEIERAGRRGFTVVAHRAPGSNQLLLALSAFLAAGCFLPSRAHRFRKRLPPD